MSHKPITVILGNHKGPLNWPMFVFVGLVIAFWSGAYALVF